MRRVSRQHRIRHALITNWRGIPDGPLLDSPAVELGSLIPGILKEWKIGDSLRAEEVSAVWRECVEPFILKFTSPDSFKRGVLTVLVSQPAVHHTLSTQKGVLLARLQERLGTDLVRDLRFRNG